MPEESLTSDIDNVNSNCCISELQASSISDENSYDLGECNKPFPSLEFSTEYSAFQKTNSTASSTTSLYREYNIFLHQPSATTVATDFAQKSIVETADNCVSQLHHQDDVNPMYRSQV